MPLLAIGVWDNGSERRKEAKAIILEKREREKKWSQTCRKLCLRLDVNTTIRFSFPVL